MPKAGLDLPNDDEQSDNFPFAVARDRYYVIRKPGTDGGIVAKFDGGRPAPRVPKKIHDHDDFVVTYPGSKSAFESASVDGSVELTDAEIEMLEQHGYPVR